MGDFKEGDLVKLKSGGPVMTVSDLESAGTVYCQYFDGYKLVGCRFSPTTLEQADKPHWDMSRQTTSE